VLFPAYYVLVVRREGLDQLGITRRWWGACPAVVGGG